MKMHFDEPELSSSVHHLTASESVVGAGKEMKHIHCEAEL